MPRLDAEVHLKPHESLAMIQQALTIHAQRGVPLSVAAKHVAAKYGLDQLMVRAVADSMVQRVRPVGAYAATRRRDTTT